MNELTSDIAPLLSKNLLDIQATVECGSTLKRIYDMIRTHNQLHHVHKYSQNSSEISPVWLNGFMCLYESRCFDFESGWCNSNIAKGLSKASINIHATQSADSLEYVFLTC